MGYTTIYEGEFKLNKPLDEDVYNTILKLVDDQRLRWVPTEDRKGIVWDGYEKFKGKYAIEQIWYLAEDILEPRGYIVNGIVNARGEDEDDKWHIQVENNSVDSKMGFHSSVPEPISHDTWAEAYYGRPYEKENEPLPRIITYPYV